jgi:hypothetical protein
MLAGGLYRKGNEASKSWLEINGPRVGVERVSA